MRTDHFDSQLGDDRRKRIGTRRVCIYYYLFYKIDRILYRWQSGSNNNYYYHIRSFIGRYEI